MATMTEIARLAGVSRGTVDRVINNRGGVGSETAERIMRAAAQLQYSPNKVARSLSGRKRNFLLTFIMLNPGKTHFYQDVHTSALRMADSFQEAGVTIKQRFIESWDEQALLEQLDGAVADGSAGIAIYATNDAAVLNKIREITQSGILVVTVGSEIADCGQIGFVGSDAARAGRTAAGLIHLIQRNEIRLGVILGYRSSVYHKGRLSGLCDGLNALGRPWSIAFTECNNDDEFDCFDIVKQQMQAHPETNTLFLSTSSVYGACRALERLNLPALPHVICYDNTPGIREMMRKGIISAAIGQEPERQGSEPLRMLFECIAFGTPPDQEKIYTEDQIFIVENL